ncbi:MAG: aminotransferase class V-fold PLP-dependent enzyme [Planctomycetaceae bacterium]
MNPPESPENTHENISSQWELAEGVTYLNHGSFGPSPNCVRAEREKWTRQLEHQPMNFFLREMEEELIQAERKLADFVGAPGKDLVFVDNATFGMNVVANSLPLQADDEVLLTDHEYGAVNRIWQRVCRNADAKVVTAKLPYPMTSVEAIIDAIMDKVSTRTRMIVVSHVTSPTAVTLPVQDICRRARERNIPVCVDGPHAVGMIPLNIRELGCDFYTASCHKWLSAPFGTGFLYVAPKWQAKLVPAVLSWGGSICGSDFQWQDEFRWMGTRDPAGFLAVPRAIEFLEEYGLENFRTRTHQLACQFRERMTELTGLQPFVPESSEWLGSMAAVPLPPLNEQPPKPGRLEPLQMALWERYRIEIPVVHWQGHRFLRVSCHLYNSSRDLDVLMQALSQLL